MRGIFLGAGLLALGGCAIGEGAPYAGTCSSASPARWSAGVDPGTVTREEGLGAAGLRADAVRMEGASAAKPGHVYLGQTATRTKLDLRLVMETREAPGGGSCAMPRRLDATLRYAQREVRIARELIADACLQREVEAHEMRHVALDDEVLAAFEPVLRQRVAELAQQLRPAYGARPGEAKHPLNETARAWLRETSDEFEAVRRKRHREEIDTPEEYARVRTICRGKARELFAQRSPAAIEDWRGSR